MSGSCEICQKQASQRCGNCQKVFYCSKEHQRSGWQMHKSECRPFSISEDPILGRHLVATRTIKNGEIVLKEPPLIWGPPQSTMPVCLGCGQLIDEKNNIPCVQCGWPMCSEICQKAPCHIPECRYTVLRGDKVSIKNLGVVHPTYQCVLVLRCLYQKQFLPEVWKKLEQLESHCEERKHTANYENERIYVAQFIRRFFKIDVNEEEILKICGILMVNGHELPISDPPQTAIYEKASMLEHSCRANCSKSFAKDGSVVIVAGKTIEMGEHLSICYTDPLWTTSNRRLHLYKTKFFSCNCERCSDPTEFGTNFSAIRCKGNCEGALLPKSFLESTDINTELQWNCNKCKNSISSYLVQEIFEKLETDLAEIKNCSDNDNDCKKFISYANQFLTENHSYISEVKWLLAQNIGQSSEGLSNVSDDDLVLKIELCQKVLKIFELIVPGERRLLGLILFEIHSGLGEMLRRNGPYLDPDLTRGKLQELKSILERSLEMLKHEQIGRAHV